MCTCLDIQYSTRNRNVNSVYADGQGHSIVKLSESRRTRIFKSLVPQNPYEIWGISWRIEWLWP